MSKRNKTTSNTRDKWKGYTYEQKKELQENIAHGRELFRQLHNRVTHSDIDIDMIYNELFELVESLYGELDLNNLIQDNHRRWKAEKERVRDAHDSSG